MAVYQTVQFPSIENGIPFLLLIYCILLGKVTYRTYGLSHGEVSWHIDVVFISESFGNWCIDSYENECDSQLVFLVVFVGKLSSDFQSLVATLGCFWRWTKVFFLLMVGLFVHLFSLWQFIFASTSFYENGTCHWSDNFMLFLINQMNQFCSCIFK